MFGKMKTEKCALHEEIWGFWQNYQEISVNCWRRGVMKNHVRENWGVRKFVAVTVKNTVQIYKGQGVHKLYPTGSSSWSRGQTASGSLTLDNRVSYRQRECSCEESGSGDTWKSSSPLLQMSGELGTIAFWVLNSLLFLASQYWGGLFLGLWDKGQATSGDSLRALIKFCFLACKGRSVSQPLLSHLERI